MMWVIEMFKVKQPQLIKSFYPHYQNSMLQTYFDGYGGIAYVDSIEHPQSVMIEIADFVYLAGQPCLDLVEGITCSFCIIVCHSGWDEFVERVFANHVTVHTRYAFKKDTLFHKEILTQYINELENGYQMKRIDKEIYNQIMKNPYLYDLCSHYKSAEDYLEHGIGFVIVKGDDIVSGASSYTYYHGGIEVEIDTHPDYRHQGFAKIVGAKLILECLHIHLYPSWDAHTEISMKLAQSLGYQFDYAYKVYMKEDTNV